MAYPTQPRRRSNRLRNWRNGLMILMIFNHYFIDGLAYVEPGMQYSMGNVRQKNTNDNIHPYPEVTPSILHDRSLENSTPTMSPEEEFMMSYHLIAFTLKNQTKIDLNQSTNMTFQIGAHAYLPCKVASQVHNLTSRSISWIRRRDSHILTVDSFTFVADERFFPRISDITESWVLELRSVQPRDAGIYECQVGIDPKMSHFIFLNVIIPYVPLLDGTNKHMPLSSQVELRCIITPVMDPPHIVFWFHGNQPVVDYPVEQTNITHTKWTPNNCNPLCNVKIITLTSSTIEDAGSWTCVPSEPSPSKVVQHVVSKDHPSAVQHDNAAQVNTPTSAVFFTGFLLANHNAGNRFLHYVKITVVAIFASIFCHDKDDN